MEARDHYAVVCTQCGLRTKDDGLNLSCPHCGDGSLLRTEYTKKSFTISAENSGLFRYRNWLPVHREVPGSSTPAVYRSTGLGAALGLGELWISFSGYWPERGCRMASGTFKELEAYTVVGRTPHDAGVMVIASAGNTAAAFAAACRGQDFRCVLVVPERALPALETIGEITDNVLVIALEDASYNDAIAYSREIVATSDEFFAEGGVRNIGRRDGLAVVALAAYEQMGALPEFYFQAVGSGAGAIATYEAARRIAESGTDDQALPRMFLCQNSEFAPIHTAWQAERDARTEADQPRREPSQHPEVYAAELVNAAPPYSVHGGVRQILTDTSGDVLVADRAAAISAAAMFEDGEGVDIEPAAAVAVACLRTAVAEGRVPAGARVLLNVTGGGRRTMRRSQGSGGNTLEVWRMSRDYDPKLLAPKILGSLGSARISAEPSTHLSDNL